MTNNSSASTKVIISIKSIILNNKCILIKTKHVNYLSFVFELFDKIQDILKITTFCSVESAGPQFHFQISQGDLCQLSLFEVLFCPLPQGFFSMYTPVFLPQTCVKNSKCRGNECERRSPNN